MVAGWRLVRRACRVDIGFQRAVGAFVINCDEPPKIGCLGRLIEVECVDELIALVLAHDHCEYPSYSQSLTEPSTVVADGFQVVS